MFRLYKDPFLEKTVNTASAKIIELSKPSKGSKFPMKLAENNA